MRVKRLLIVEPDLAFRTLLEDTVAGGAEIETVADFPRARARMFATPLDLVVTNLRLGAFNGLHLAYVLPGPVAFRASWCTAIALRSRSRTMVDTRAPFVNSSGVCRTPCRRTSMPIFHHSIVATR